MTINPRDILVTTAVVLLVICNLYYQSAYIPKRVQAWPLRERVLPPGQHLQPLKEHLKGVRFAGYYDGSYDDRYWLKTGAVISLQRAQYALSPTLLDVEQCFRHEYVLFDCRRPECYQAPMRDRGYEPVHVLNQHTVLARRKQKWE
jgi:hypothetical protein